ncbi:MAG: hypothetical protein IMZ50_04820 [Candidatus Atribacteria bacterium]|nr:hypothetical protein [Candidatus Atribacteria bacterium]
MTNIERADAALAALGQHTAQAYRRAVPAPATAAEIEEAMIDLIADMKHLARREGVNFDEALRMAGHHYFEESRVL